MGRPAARPHNISDREDYRRWAAAQPGGRYEHVAGEVLSMVPERAAHVRAKTRMWRTLDQAIRSAGVDCEALGDGVTVEVGDDTDYEPDAIVNCGPRMGDDDIAAPNPVVVEVLSPSTRSVDTGAKLADYFRVPSIRHYLIVRVERRAIVNHRRHDDDGIETKLVADGRIDLDPPGIGVLVNYLYAA